MDNFFKHFPLVEYGNTVNSAVAVNLFAKTALNKITQSSFEIYHPYTVKEGERAETIANLYYGDPGYDWIVYYSNNILDPYYDWYMDDRVFKGFIADKYGSVSNAQRKIKQYRSNYINDPSIITVAAYNGLAESQKSFWAPITSVDRRVISYERKSEDIIINSNITKQLQTTIVGNTSFQTNEYVYQLNGTVAVSSGIVSFANSTVSIVTNVSGTLSTSYNLIGGESGANATVQSITTMSTGIAPEIQVYFSPVSYFDYEEEINEAKKNIRLIDVAYVTDLEKQLKDLLAS